MNKKADDPSLHVLSQRAQKTIWRKYTVSCLLQSAPLTYRSGKIL